MEKHHFSAAFHSPDTPAGRPQRRLFKPFLLFFSLVIFLPGCQYLKDRILDEVRPEPTKPAFCMPHTVGFDNPPTEVEPEPRFYITYELIGTGKLKVSQFPETPEVYYIETDQAKPTIKRLTYPTGRTLEAESDKQGRLLRFRVEGELHEGEFDEVTYAYQGDSVLATVKREGAYLYTVTFTYKAGNLIKMSHSDYPEEAAHYLYREGADAQENKWYHFHKAYGAFTNNGVSEQVPPGIWIYNGYFSLIDVPTPMPSKHLVAAKRYFGSLGYDFTYTLDSKGFPTHMTTRDESGNTDFLVFTSICY